MQALYGTRLGKWVVEAVPLRYDDEAWIARFDRLWPAGSPASLSYRKRIASGPDYEVERPCGRRPRRARSRAQPERRDHVPPRLLLAACSRARSRRFSLSISVSTSASSFSSRGIAIEEFRRASPLATAAIFFRDLRRRHRFVRARGGHPVCRVGAIFGLLWGTLIVSFAASIGATLAFLSSRFFSVTRCAAASASDCGQSTPALRRGCVHLFALRLAPVFPFVLVNSLMGLTPVKTRTFYW